jgi:multidrug resistance efflux pump
MPGSAVQAKAASEAAQQQVPQAEINLRRTQVRSPVNGYVTNLLMRVGDFAHEGATNISVIDTDSYWIDGWGRMSDSTSRSSNPCYRPA